MGLNALVPALAVVCALADGSALDCAYEACARFREAIHSLDYTPPVDRGSLRRIAYYKTHKTASSTAGSVFFRYGKRYGLKFYKHHTHIIQIQNRPPQTADVILNHVSSYGIFERGVTFRDIYHFYKGDNPNASLVTVLRDPVSHYLSYYYYFIEPAQQHVTLQQYIQRKGVGNLLSREFALYNHKDVDEFLAEYGDKFAFILITNRFDESLVAMSLEFGWSLADITYLKLLDSHATHGSKRWDGKPIKSTPRIASLDSETLKKIENITQLDKRLYDFASKQLDSKIAAAGEAFDKTLKSFRVINQNLHEFCSCKYHTQNQKEFCAWYRMTDLQYEESVIHGHPIVHMDTLPKWWAL